MSGRRLFLKSIAAAFAGGATIAPLALNAAKAELEPASPPPSTVGDLERAFRESLERRDPGRVPVLVEIREFAWRAQTIHAGRAVVTFVRGGVEIQHGNLTIIVMELDRFVPLEIRDKFSLRWKTGSHEYTVPEADLIRVELRPGEMTTRAVFRESRLDQRLQVHALDERGRRLI